MLKIRPGDKLLPVADACEMAIGVRPPANTRCRWTRRGVQGERLETVVVGGRPMTTEAAVIDFVQRRTAADQARREGVAS